MAINLNHAFTVDENGFAISDTDGNVIANLFASTDDPTVVGFNAPIGSLYLRTGVGTLYVKTGVGFTQWTVSSTPSQMSFADVLAFAAAHG